MKNSELKEFLNTFTDDSDVSVIIVNRKKHKHYPILEHHVIVDMGQPVFILDIGNPKDMEEQEIQIEGQMDIRDFPEVLP